MPAKILSHIVSVPHFGKGWDTHNKYLGGVGKS